MLSSNASEPGGRTAAFRRGARRRRAEASAPLWPGMIPESGAPRQLPAPRSYPALQQVRRQHRRRRRPPWLVGAVAVVGSLAVAALVLVYAAAASNPRQSATIADPVLGGGPGCEPARTEQLVRGNGTGSTATGQDVILAFQHAYYVARSGDMARSLTTPDAAVSSVDVIDAGIRSIPRGTQHCVMVTPMADGRFDVVITEIRPDSSVRTYRQFVSVAPREGVVVITKITAPS